MKALLFLALAGLATAFTLPRAWSPRTAVPAPSPAPTPAPAVLGPCTSYCTPGISTNGCQATMSCSGVPSVASLSGFLVTVDDLEGNKSLRFRYSISGQISVPWAPTSTSFLCVKAPTQGTPIKNSGGTTDTCEGGATLDFLDYLANHLNALGQPMPAGMTVYIQTHYKDPPAPKTTNWSDALMFTTVP